MPDLLSVTMKSSESRVHFLVCSRSSGKGVESYFPFTAVFAGLRAHPGIDNIDS